MRKEAENQKAIDEVAIETEESEELVAVAREAKKRAPKGGKNIARAKQKKVVSVSVIDRRKSHTKDLDSLACSTNIKEPYSPTLLYQLILCKEIKWMNF